MVTNVTFSNIPNDAALISVDEFKQITKDEYADDHAMQLARLQHEKQERGRYVMMTML